MKTVPNLRRRYSSFFVALSAAIATSIAFADVRPRATIQSARDVDLAFVDGQLIALAFHHGAWETLNISEGGGVATQCKLPGRAWFSMDRTLIISSFARKRPMIEIIHPVSCERIASFETDALASDADAHRAGNRVALSARQGKLRSVWLTTLQGESVATVGAVTNAEIGFSTDGGVLFNFDHAGGKHLLWRASDGASLPSPFASGDDVHFSGDGNVVFGTQPGLLTRFSWRAGGLGERINVSVHAREVMRGASVAGNSIVLQAPNPAQPASPIVRVFDTITQAEFELGRGHIDAVALAADGSAAAIAIRAARSNTITISRVSRAGLFTP